MPLSQWVSSLWRSLSPLMQCLLITLLYFYLIFNVIYFMKDDHSYEMCPKENDYDALLPRCLLGGGEITVYVTVSGHAAPIAVSVQSDATVNDLRKAIAKHTGLSEEDLDLFLAGNLLSAGAEAIADVGINAESPLRCVKRLNAAQLMGMADAGYNFGVQFRKDGNFLGYSSKDGYFLSREPVSHRLDSGDEGQSVFYGCDNQGNVYFKLVEVSGRWRLRQHGTHKDGFKGCWEDDEILIVPDE